MLFIQKSWVSFQSSRLHREISEISELVVTSNFRDYFLLVIVLWAAGDLFI